MEKRPPLHLGVVVIEKGAFGSPSTTLTNFNFTYDIYGYNLVETMIINVLIYDVCLKIYGTVRNNLFQFQVTNYISLPSINNPLV